MRDPTDAGTLEVLVARRGRWFVVAHQVSSSTTTGVFVDRTDASDDFDAFYRVMAPRLIVLGRAITGSRTVAEEVAQEALFVAHRRWDRVARLDRPDLWVRRVATNLCISSWRRRIVEHRANQRHERVRSCDPAEVVHRDEGLWAEVRRLPHRQAAAVSLHYGEQLTTAEIGEVLGCSASTVQTHLARGRATLRDRLDGSEGGPEDA